MKKKSLKIFLRICFGKFQFQRSPSWACQHHKQIFNTIYQKSSTKSTEIQNITLMPLILHHSMLKKKKNLPWAKSLSNPHEELMKVCLIKNHSFFQNQCNMPGLILSSQKTCLQEQKYHCQQLITKHVYMGNITLQGTESGKSNFSQVITN